MIDFSNGVDGFFHSLIPATLRASVDASSLRYIRIRTLSAMLVIGTALAALSVLVFVTVHAIFFYDQLKYDTITAAIFVAFAMQTVFFYKYGNDTLSSLLLSNFYLLMIMVLVIMNGGYDAPSKVLLLVSPVVFFMLGGIRSGIQNAMFVALAGVGFGYLKSIGFEFVNVFGSADMHISFALSWAAAIIGVSASVMAYDTELQKRG